MPASVDPIQSKADAVKRAAGAAVTKVTSSVPVGPVKYDAPAKSTVASTLAMPMGGNSPFDDPNYREPAPPPASAYAGQGAAMATADQNRTAPKVTPGELPKTPAPAKSQFDIQREQVAADRVAEEKRRIAAVDRAVSNRGLSDSGIQLGQERQARADVGALAGQRLSQIDAGEAAQAAASTEADKGRAFLSSENALDRAAGKEQFYAGLNQAKELAVKGLDLQASAQELQKLGMTQQNAQYYAGLAQADRLAQKGFSLQEQAQELTKQGMTAEDARYYAGLAQARVLAERGMDIDTVRNELTRQGMTQQDAQYYAGLAHQEKMAKDQNSTDIQKGILVDVMSKIPVDDFYVAKIQGLLSAFGTGTNVFAPGTSTATSYTPETIPQGTKTPPDNQWKVSLTPKYPGDKGVIYFNPDTDSYQSAPNPKYKSFYG